MLKARGVFFSEEAEVHHNIYKARIGLQKWIMSPNLSLAETIDYVMKPNTQPDQNPNMHPQLSPWGVHCLAFVSEALLFCHLILPVDMVLALRGPTSYVSTRN